MDEEFKMGEKSLLEWDSDFTKLTPAERKKIELAEMDFQKGETVKHTDIDWN